MKTIGILGCGWLGKALAKSLIEENYVVKGTTTSSHKISDLKAENITPYLINLSDENYSELDSFLLHLDLLIIAIPPSRIEQVPTYAENFKKLIAYLSPDLPIFMMSSISVYAPQKSLIFENNKLFSEEITAQQIREAEKTLQSYTKQLTILRLGGLFGTDRHPVEYISRLPSLNNPDLSINMVHQLDILQFTKFLISQKQVDSIYNLVSPTYLNRRTYYSQMASELKIKLPPEDKNNWDLEKKVDGSKIMHQSGLTYLY